MSRKAEQNLLVFNNKIKQFYAENNIKPFICRNKNKNVSVSQENLNKII